MTWIAIILITASFRFNHVLADISVLECSDESPCVRFCCSNCSYDFDVKNMPGADNFKGDYKILQGRLCSEMYRLEPEEMPEDDWSFLAVRTR